MQAAVAGHPVHALHVPPLADGERRVDEHLDEAVAADHGTHFAKRTLSFLPAAAAGAVANVVLNVIFVPRFGALAAAWISVVTYAIYAGVDLLLCRQIDRYEYPLAKCGLVMGAMTATFVACQWVQAGREGFFWALVPPVVVWTAWAGALGYPLFRQYRQYLAGQAAALVTAGEGVCQ